MTRSSTPRSRAAARIVSAAVVIRSPLTRFIGKGWVWRHTSSPGRRGRGSALSMAAKTGWAMVAGSHQPRSRAAVRCEKAAVLGRTSCHAASSSNCVRLSAAAYTPRVMRSHSRPLSHPRAGERGGSCTVTPEACGRGQQSSEPPAHLWTGLGAGSLLWRTGHLPPDPSGNRSLATGLLPKPVSRNLKMGQIRVASDRFRRVASSYVGDARVTSTAIGLSVSTQLISPVIRPTARRSVSTACRCASACAGP
jgi:hypothetical protein